MSANIGRALRTPVPVAMPATEWKLPVRPYGCHNKPRPVAGAVTHQAQAGWAVFRDGYNRPCPVPVYIDIKHVMSTECRYDASAKDARCTGCQHINQGAV